MKKINLHSISLCIALPLIIIAVFVINHGYLAISGLLLITFFGLLALGFSGYKSLKGYVFTTMIFAGVTAALFYPEYFIQIGDFKVTTLIIPLIQIIMFGMGTSMSLNDFASIFFSF